MNCLASFTLFPPQTRKIEGNGMRKERGKVGNEDIRKGIGKGRGAEGKGERKEENEERRGERREEREEGSRKSQENFGS